MKNVALGTVVRCSHTTVYLPGHPPIKKNSKFYAIVSMTVDGEEWEAQKVQDGNGYSGRAKCEFTAEVFVRKMKRMLSECEVQISYVIIEEKP